MTRAVRPGTVQLKVLGRLDLTIESGESLEDVLCRPKELALVVYLAMTGPGGAYVTRDTLLPLFWPELDEQRARHALRQMLYSLRQVLGPEVILSRGTQEVCVAPERLRCDAAELCAAATSGHPERAVELYTGEFLPGFNPGDVSTELEHWIEDTRAHIRRVVLEASGTLAAAAESEGRLEAAIQWSRKGAEIDPLSEEDVHRLVRLLGQTGSLPLAVQAYEHYRRRLESELDLQPGEALQAEVRRLVGRGGERSGPPPVSVALSSGTVDDLRASGAPEPPADTEVKARRRPGLALRGTALVTAALWVVAGISLLGGKEPAPVRTAPVRLAIVPMPTASGRPPGTAPVAYVTAWALSDVEGLEVADPGTVLAVLQRTGPSDQTEVVTAVRHSLGVDLVLTARPLPGSPDRALLELYGRSSEHMTGRAAVPAGVEEAGAAVPGVVELLRTRGGVPGLGMEGGAAPDPTSNEALAAYIRADSYLYRGEPRAAVQELERAVSLDPDFAMAWHRLSVAAGLVFDGALADSAAERAAAVARGLPRRMALLIEARRAYRKGAPDEAETALRGLLALYPNDIEAQHQLAEVMVHYNPIRGRSALEAIPLLRGSAALGVSRSEALYHMTQLALQAGDTAQVRRTGGQLLSLSAAAYRAPQVRVMLAHLAGDPVAWRRELGRLRSSGYFTILSATHNVAVHGHSPDAASDVARLLTDADQPSDVRALGYRVLADLALARGRPSEAWRYLDRAARETPEAALVHQAFMAALPSVPVDSARLEEIGRGVAALDGQGDPDPPWFFVEQTLNPELPTYLATLLSLKQGRLDDAVGRLRSLASDPLGSPSGVRLLAHLSQRYRLVTNAPSGHEIDPTAGLQLSVEQAVLSPLYSTPDLRYLYALRVAAGGRPRLALRLLGSLEESSIADLAMAGPARLAAARIHEQLGETDRAARLYASALALWEEAEPAYRPMVEQAREGLARQTEGSPVH
jgi:DNA-binding SARP family transcriptional activator